MDDYENNYRNAGSADDIYDQFGQESDGDFSASGNIPENQESKMPPRNILETDSAKYTAEYIKEVVKGLYTVGPGSFSDSPRENRDDYGASGQNTRAEVSSGRTTAARRESTSAPKKRRAELPGQLEIETAGRDADALPQRRERLPETLEARFEQRHEPNLEAQPEARPQWKPEWKSDKTYKRHPDSQFDTEPFQPPERRPETPPLQPPERRTDNPPEMRREPHPEPPREAAPPRAKMTAFDKPAFDAHEDEEFTPDSFLKSFENKSHSDAIDFNPRPRERKTFSSLRGSGNIGNIGSTGELENVLAGKSTKRPADRPAERAVERPVERAVFPESKEPSVRERDYHYADAQDDDEYVYIKQSKVYGESGYDSAFQGFEEGPAEPAREKIPIVINKTIEPRPKKTADDYSRNAGKNNYDKQFRKIEPSDGRSKGANVFAAVFMIAAIAIIGVLVWKINSISGESKAASDDAERLVLLEGQVKTLSAKNSELESEIETLNNEIDYLRNENARLIDAASEEPEPEGEEEAAPSASTPGLDNGFYTVKSGDTLWRISEEFLGSGEEYLKIATANNMEPSQSLVAGQKLKIPNQ